MESGRIKEIERPCQRTGLHPGEQAEMGEDLSDHCGLFDSGDNFHGAITVGAVFDVDIEYPLE